MTPLPPVLPTDDDRYCRGYCPPAGAFDELASADGEVRPHWRPFVRSLNRVGSGELVRRWAEARHIIHENGVTYNVYGDPAGLERPWQLDPIPLVIGAGEAQRLDNGLRQRAALLEALLADLYGPQRVLAEGLFPPELVFAGPRFLRAMRGSVPAGGRWLYLHAIDLGRAADGRMIVIGDRTQNPSGAGYALENRIVLSRVLPEAFGDLRVQRLAGFFRSLQVALRAAAPRNKDNPRIVLLTPGPLTETYFEHAYLARYLGYTLAEGGDLTVRDGRVFLKLLGGLQPVDVILRRLDDDFCDPLELRPDSSLGVPGLAQAVRSGAVTVANALGSGVVESPGVAPFLRAVCRRLLGQDLLLESAPAWWCGDPLGLSHVLANLPRMTVKAAFPAARRAVAFGDRLDRDQLDRLAAVIQAKPHHYVGQELVRLSTTPVLVGDQLVPRQAVMRAYLTPKGDSFTVMPGGLTRVSASADALEVSMQHGGGSKDTWVLADGPVSSFSLLPPAGTAAAVTRGGGDLPSRVADNLFWLGRYAERAEGRARLLRVVVTRVAEAAGLGEVPELVALRRGLGHVVGGKPVRSPDPAAEVMAAVFDARRDGSLAGVLNVLGRVAGTVRDRISTDMWQVLSGLDLDDVRPARPGGRPPLADVMDVLNRTVLRLAAFAGLAGESMTRGHGWRFLDVGRKLERCLQTAALVRETLGTSTASEPSLLEALLEAADGAMTYRRRYMGSVHPATVLDLLLLDETNPRSLASQMAALGDDVDHLPREADRAGRSPEQRLMMSLLTAVRLADGERLAAAQPNGTRPHLRVLLDELAAELPTLSDLITQSYFAHLQASRHLSSGQWSVVGGQRKRADGPDLADPPPNSEGGGI